MAVSLISRNYNTAICVFAIDTEDELGYLPKLNSAGKDNLSTVHNCNQGSRACASDGKVYVLTGDNMWIELKSSGGGSGGSSNYNELLNTPITNLIGTSDNPIVLLNLQSGVYNVTGDCKITNNSEPFVEEGNNDLYFVDSETKTVRKLTGDTFETFKENAEGEITTEDVITTDTIDQKIDETLSESSISIEDIQKLFSNQ